MAAAALAITLGIAEFCARADRAFDDHRVLRQAYAAQWARALTIRTVNTWRGKPQVESVFELMDRAASLGRIRTRSTRQRRRVSERS